MGASESKIAEKASAKPEVPAKNPRVAQLIDPRSPSMTIDRTPIQVAGVKTANVASERPSQEGDPRSPTVGIARTPVRELMRAKVGTFARRLGMLFHVEAEGKISRNGVPALEHRDILKNEELDSTEPLLTPQRPRVFGSIVEHREILTSSVQNGGASCSPFVLLGEPQVEIETENANLEEAEEARESPLHKRLSMSLITCHEGAPSSQILAEVHPENGGPEEAETLQHNVDHVYACPAVTLESARDSSDPTTEPQEEDAKEALPAVGHRLTLDIKSPSQVVFKPQWLGKGFGATGLRARTVQGAKGGSSPLAISVVVKNVNNESKGNSGKQKLKEGRSPLQVINSQRGHPQMRLKGSTPEKPRLGQLDRRLLAVTLNKENQ